jgi:hypothetical protein
MNDVKGEYTGAIRQFKRRRKEGSLSSNGFAQNHVSGGWPVRFARAAWRIGGVAVTDIDWLR